VLDLLVEHSAEPDEAVAVPSASHPLEVLLDVEVAWDRGPQVPEQNPLKRPGVLHLAEVLGDADLEVPLVRRLGWDVTGLDPVGETSDRVLTRNA
jgi:hypothetical protein